MFIIKNNDITDETGKTISFGIKNFINNICSGSCIICGALREGKIFHDQHTLPLWLLKKFDLYKNKITVTNNPQIDYSQYKISCCQECNTFFENTLEKSVRELLDTGYEKVSEYVIKNGPWLFVIWLSFIFFKAHYKDIIAKFKNNFEADNYELERIYHIYNIARSLYAGTKIDKSALSSFYLIKSKNTGDFDFCEIYDSKSILIRYKNIAMISVLDDGCGVHSLYGEIKKISRHLSAIQLREVFAKISYLSTILKDRPIFGSGINSTNKEFIIDCKYKNYIETNKFDPVKFGSLFYYLCGDFLKNLPLDDKFEIEQNIKLGNWTFLFNKKGEFIE